MGSYKIQDWKKYGNADFHYYTFLGGDELKISKFPELNLMQMANITEKGKGIPYGLVAVVNGLDSFIGRVDNKTRAVVSDARFSVRSHKHTIPEIHSYFSKGD